MTSATSEFSDFDGSDVDRAMVQQYRADSHDAEKQIDLEIIGQSFLLDNIKEFSSTSFVPGSSRKFRAFKMDAFMSGAWIIDGRDKPSIAAWLSALDKETRTQARAGTLRLLFDMSNEGLPFEQCISCIEAAHRDVASAGISGRVCVFLNQNVAFASAYEKWASRGGIEDRFSFLCYDYYPRRFVGKRQSASATKEEALEAYRQDLARQRERMFLSLNFTPRPHRIALVSWMLGMFFDHRALISFRGFSMNKLDATNCLPTFWFPEEHYVELGFKRLKEIGTLDLDLAAYEDAHLPEFDIADKSLFDASYFSVVSETEIMGGSQQRITEKIFKPMAAFHPFVVFGNSNSLARLRDMGFQTFHPFINEDYDFVDDARLRVHMAMGEVTKLMRLSASEIHDWYNSISSRLMHNYQHLHGPADELYSRSIEPNILRRLESL